VADTGRGPVHERRVRVVSRHGLHALPAARLVAVAGQFQSQVTLARVGEPETLIDSVMAVLSLGAGAGEELVLRARGSDALAAVQSLAGLFAAGLGGDGPGDAD